jgi:hypothetical protein
MSQLDQVRLTGWDGADTEDQQPSGSGNWPRSEHRRRPAKKLLERLTRIELALSAWESERFPLARALIWRFDCPRVTAGTQ